MELDSPDNVAKREMTAEELAARAQEGAEASAKMMEETVDEHNQRIHDEVELCRKMLNDCSIPKFVTGSAGIRLREAMVVECFLVA